MKDRLILKKVKSPFTGVHEDDTGGVILEQKDIENNFVYLKGNIICSGTTNNNQLILHTIGGGKIIIDISNTTINNEAVILETQTIASEDNNIELNYGGNNDTAVGGGITVLNGIKDGVNSEIKTDENGNWVMNPPLATKEYTPSSTNDEFGKVGDTVWDDGYIYIKTNAGWKRSTLENF